MSPRIIHNATHDDGTLTIHGPDGGTTFDFDDAFYVRREQVGRLPAEFDGCISDAGDGYARVRWPEPVRWNGTRGGRLGWYSDNVFAPAKVEVLEADVDPVRRYLAEFRYEFPERWRVLYFDLETEKVRDWSEPWRSRILSFSWRSASTGYAGHVRLEALDDCAERVLLRRFLRVADRHDVLVAWNGDRFDAPVVQGRMRALDIPFDPRAYHWLDHLKVFKKYWARSEDGQVKSSFALDAIAEVLLGERKLDVAEEAKARGFRGGDLFHWVWREAPDLLERYNDLDVELMARIDAKTGFLDQHFALCRVCHAFPGRESLYPSSLVDGRMIRAGAHRGYRFPTRRWVEDDDRQQSPALGAYVPPAMVGLHEGVAVIDYSRMYPAIICAFNMSLETEVDDGDARVPLTDAEGVVIPDRFAARFRSNPEGILPASLRELFMLRERYSVMRDESEPTSPAFWHWDRMSTACKNAINSFYGVLLAAHSRYYRPAIGGSITSMGRLLLRSTADHVKSKGHVVVAGDTDSNLFKATDAEARARVEELNRDVIPGILRALGARLDEVKIGYEKAFKRLLIVAKKNYVGTYSLYKGKPAKPDAPPEVRGLAVVRSDQTRATRALQRLAIALVMDARPEAEVHAAMMAWRSDFFRKDLDLQEVMMSKGLSKALDAYSVKATQVRVAEWMAANGYDVGAGTKVQYLYAEGRGAVHPDALGADDVDRRAYWTKYVWPPTERLLKAAFPRTDWASFRMRGREAPAGQARLFKEGNEFVLKTPAAVAALG